MASWDHEDLKSGSPRDLSSLKKRLAKKAQGTSPKEMPAPLADMLKQACKELETLKTFVRDLYQEAISTEDARDFTIGVQESLRELITSWGEKVLTPEEYMEQQRVAQERADDERELERLAKNLGKQVV